MGDGSDGAQASVSTGSLRLAGSWNDGALGAASSQVPGGRAAQGALHPSPQHPELGPGHRACSWPDSNELGQQSSERAGATKIRAAISTPCFEYWLLLHFTLTNKPFQGTPGGPSACEQVIREVGTYLEGYRKADAGTYGRCRELLPTAIQNAKRNRRSGGSSSTNVWELVERLQELRTMRRKRFPDGTRPFVFGATLHRVRFGLSIAAMAVTLRRAAYPLLLLTPSPRRQSSPTSAFARKQPPTGWGTADDAGFGKPGTARSLASMQCTNT